ncbi:hypothetical protein NDS46_05155 [Paenibacillus thiaminolyticus]|uniref:hypothetical protein n=1 Tax=Paenibacillus thiaminolyticus TaxID=49283 RepID=UPI00232CA119|nr:hypothetical protein [Paenibacillus thiaminolyticus]WCF09290.1 hypothetical protein NDS46_05155 [Paenibacillus thiaminolyticus]
MRLKLDNYLPDWLIDFIRSIVSQRTEEGTLLIGLTGEKAVNYFRFYTVFKDDVSSGSYSEGI